jgi:hypothetical protein
MRCCDNSRRMALNSGEATSRGRASAMRSSDWMRPGPVAITTTRSASKMASSMACVTKITVRFVRCLDARCAGQDVRNQGGAERVVVKAAEGDIPKRATNLRRRRYQPRRLVLAGDPPQRQGGNWNKCRPRGSAQGWQQARTWPNLGAHALASSSEKRCVEERREVGHRLDLFEREHVVGVSFRRLHHFGRHFPIQFDVGDRDGQRLALLTDLATAISIISGGLAIANSLALRSISRTVLTSCGLFSTVSGCTPNTIFRLPMGVE